MHDSRKVPKKHTRWLQAQVRTILRFLTYERMTAVEFEAEFDQMLQQRYPSLMNGRNHLRPGDTVTTGWPFPRRRFFIVRERN